MISLLAPLVFSLLLYPGADTLPSAATLSPHDLGSSGRQGFPTIRGWFDERAARGKRLMYVADSFSKVVVVTLDGTKVGEVDGFREVQTVAVGPAGRLFVLDAAATIYEFKKGKTTPFLTITPPPSFGGGTLSDISVGVDGALYVLAGMSTSQDFGGLLVYPRDATKPSRIWSPEFILLSHVTSDRQKNVYISFQWYFSSSGNPGVFVLDKGSLGYDMRDPRGLAIAHNGDVIICDWYYDEIETFAPGQTKPYSIMHVGCDDFTLGPRDKSIFMGDGTRVLRYSYPSGKLRQTIGGFQGAGSVAIEGDVTD